MKTPQLPIPRLATTLGLANEVWLKREDKHHYGSHKGRSIPLMINECVKRGIFNFVISSSGNAALAALQAVETYNKSRRENALTLQVLVGEHIAIDKLEELKAANSKTKSNRVTIEQCPNPKQRAFQIERAGAVKWLRQSTDEMALVGYEELADELAKIPNLSAVFVPTSSGTTAQGLYQGFKKLGLTPQIHIVQTDVCHPIVDVVTAELKKGEAEAAELKKGDVDRGDDDKGGIEKGDDDKRLPTSLAPAIVDRVAHRKQTVLDAIKNTGGAGWTATNQNISEAIDLMKKNADLTVSGNSALSLVGLVQAIKAGWDWSGPVVCLITGK